MSAPICPYCGDGMESIGTLNHIECATKLLAEVDRYYAQRDAIRLDQGPTYGVLEARADAAIAACLDEIKRLNEICDRLAAAGRSDHA